ncbi:MAG: hypothetical protein GAK28_01275 [Luteibacter sp.]|uniref:hypothetical protein n=1 Tax=Luteibacter sp. TaxID=1886636 RepID=UPI00137FC986|nr:hypothetical protein [Luteibacter sp.]KAF1008294.1 MAG: hypothetical protein GAK28_01275 [Luteibacter sp.]
MKLVNAVLRLLAAGRFATDRPVRPRTWNITVPASHDAAQVSPLLIDMHWETDPGCGRPVARWHGHAASHLAA